MLLESKIKKLNEQVEELRAKSIFKESSSSEDTLTTKSVESIILKVFKKFGLDKLEQSQFKHKQSEKEKLNTSKNLLKSGDILNSVLHESEEIKNQASYIQDNKEQNTQGNFSSFTDRVGFGLEKLRPRNKEPLMKHQEEVCSIALLSESRLASCSLDKTIQIYDLKDQKLIKTVRIFETGVTSISSLREKWVICSSESGQIKILDENFEIKALFNPHSRRVNKVLELSNKRFCSISDDFTFRIWESEEPYKSINFFDLSEAVTGVLEIKDKTNIVLSTGNKLYFIAQETPLKLDDKVLDVVSFGSNSIAQVNNDIIVGSVNALIVIDYSKKVIIRSISFKESGNLITVVSIELNTILCSLEGVPNKKGYLTVCNYLKSKFLPAIKFHEDTISGIIKLKNGLITCSKDGTVKYWEFPEDPSISF